MQSESSNAGSAATVRRLGPDDWHNLVARWRSGVILAAGALGIAWLGGWLFQLLLLAGAAVAWREWVRLVAPSGAGLLNPAGWLILAAAWGGGVVVGPVAGILVALGLAGAILVPCSAWTAPSARLADRCWLALGPPYLAVGGLSIIWLRADSAHGLALVLFLLGAVWATDICAFFVGREIGGPRLAPEISPGKTWAGLVGGVAAAGVAGVVVAVACGAAVPALAAGVAVVLACAGQAGDLFESALKRRYKVKDSGQLIPGHGGLLDRIDGLIAAAPVLALFHATVGASIGWW